MIIENSNIHKLVSSSNFKFFFDQINIPVAFISVSNEVIFKNLRFSKLNAKTKKAITSLNLDFNENSHNYNIDSSNLIIAVSKVFENDNLTGFFLQVNCKESILPDQNKLHSIAHDFNNILTSVNNSLSLIKTKNLVQPDGKALIENIGKCTFRAAEITRELLSKNTASIVKTEFDILAVIKEVIDAITHTADKKVVFNLTGNAKQIFIYGNPNDIYRSIFNIVLNAVEAIEDKGEISITSSVKNPDFIKQNIRIETKNNFAEILIKDNGCGMSPDTINKIFDLNFSTKKRKRKSGLGLSIVKKSIEEHEGKIFVESTKGKGTAFSIYLPSVETETKHKTNNKNRTILIAEDEVMLRELLRDLIESYQYNVIEASNGKEALDILNENRNINLLIIDRKMPDIDGIECIRKIREKLKSDLPIILASGSPSINEIDYSKLKIDAILNKPYNFPNMLNLISSLLD